MSEWEPPEVIIAKPRPWRRFVLVFLVLAAGAVALWYFRDDLLSTKSAPLPAIAERVRSDVTPAGDSLDIIVSWELTSPGRGGPPDSVRVEVGVEGTDAVVHLLPSKWRADTLRVASPTPGNTAQGHSCVAPVRGSRLFGESCTPWQFVRPAAEEAPRPGPDRSESPKKKTARDTAAAGSQVLRIVIWPSGRQVDPDLDGKCAEWQRDNPGRTVWLEVNESAVAECMGPNGKPTVAQFCAFAVLQDGERVKTENSNNNPYCDRLYQEWVRERIS